MATRDNGKAGHMSDIMLICNKFKEVRRAVGPNDTWADVMEYKNSTSANVELGTGFPVTVQKYHFDMFCRYWFVFMTLD